MATTPDDIPTFRIDIARAPEDRYVDVAAAFGPRIRTLGHVFDELLESMLGSVWLARIARFAARLFLRRVHDEEQTREIRGFVDVAGCDLFLVVALNVFLDAMMGCTAGCVTVEGKGKGKERLMHFRTLDWGLDPLRDLVVVLEFVDSSKDPDRVIATSVTYAGFVGVLTGVRENLSISLNYRPLHLCDNSHLKKHQLLVILGFRPSVSSIIRKTLFAQQDSSSLVEQAKTLAAVRSAPCYLTLCDGSHAVVVEKDLVTGRIREDDRFIVQTNHDSSEAARCGAEARSEPLTPHPVLWLRDSSDRMDVIHGKWTLHCQVDGEDAPELVDGEKRAVSEEVLREWMVDERISNGFTHFACIMDPLTGRVPWLRRGPAPEVKSVEE
ncbi:hypothetical protein ACJZ2D_007115 [Fusarium nematophilum]